MPHTFSTIVSRLLAFREERDWGQFHRPKDLAMALGIEVGELQERLLWKTDEQIKAMTAEEGVIEAIADEMADVLIYLMLLAEGFGVDLLEATSRKIEKNAAKYPADLARGNARKYTELEG